MLNTKENKLIQTVDIEAYFGHCEIICISTILG